MQMQFDQAVKERLEVLSGSRGDQKPSALPETASLSDVIARINELQSRMQGS